MLGLRRAGCTDAELVAMDLATFDRSTLRDAEGLRQKPRYRALLLDRGLAAGPQDLAFVTLAGEPIAAPALAAHLRALRAIRIAIASFTSSRPHPMRAMRAQEPARQAAARAARWAGPARGRRTTRKSRRMPRWRSEPRGGRSQATYKREKIEERKTPWQS